MIRSKRAEEARPKEPQTDSKAWEAINDALDDLDDVLKKTTTQVDVDDIFDSWSPMSFGMLLMRSKLKAIGISPSFLDEAPLAECYNALDALNEMRDDYIQLYGPYHEDE
jgi:hypothetical protein